MRMTDFLASEWKPSLGCTEPAAVAWAAALAAEQGAGQVRQVRLVCDPRTYKNCYAVGLPNSGHATGILWAMALGAYLPDGSLGLRSFEGTNPASIESARLLLEQHAVHVEVDAEQTGLLVDVTVVREGGVGRAVLAREHTHLTRLEKDGRLVGGAESAQRAVEAPSLRQAAAALSIKELMDLARTLEPEDRALLQEGVVFNLAIARHGLSLLPADFVCARGHGLPDAAVPLGERRGLRPHVWGIPDGDDAGRLWQQGHHGGCASEPLGPGDRESRKPD